MSKWNKKFKKGPKKPALVDPYIVYTDGSALNNPGPGGYSAIAVYGETVVKIGKGYFLTTNNRMEIMGVIATLEEFGPGKHFIIATDSQYTIDGCTSWLKGWVRNDWQTFTGAPVKNADLWKIMDELLKVNKVVFHKVKAHIGDPFNEMADTIAKQHAKEPTTIDEGYITSLGE